ncbi:MAG: hypothetical protein IJ769_10105, partial [Clostridia bacterium]|nr:hypothetical protein [Clostridia bacterium]
GAIFYNFPGGMTEVPYTEILQMLDDSAGPECRGSDLKSSAPPYKQHSNNAFECCVFMSAMKRSHFSGTRVRQIFCTAVL